MKNVTVSLSDDVYRTARVRAAEEGSSLSLEAQQQRIQAEIEGFSARHNVDRDTLHDRAVR